MGLTASTIILDPEECEEGVVAHAVRAPDSDQYYALVDTGTNATIEFIQDLAVELTSWQ